MYEPKKNNDYRLITAWMCRILPKRLRHPAETFMPHKADEFTTRIMESQQAKDIPVLLWYIPSLCLMS
jgi:hypothetical protein